MNNEDELIESDDFIIGDDKSVNKNAIKIDSPLDISELMRDRNGELPPIEKLQEIQNKIMGRSADFSKLSNEEKEKIIFKEIEDYHFKNMPSIEEMQKEVKNNYLTYTVEDINDPTKTVGLGNPHINIKQENIRLNILADSKTITFNNKELLEEYRKKMNENTSKESDKNISKAQMYGEIAHNERVFE